ncbi:MAG TPA: endonuclease III [Candidatus Eisenbacteria bacterium]|nr:endonuclease III [Candidatus Eisenbacteria bacterium]
MSDAAVEWNRRKTVLPKRRCRRGRESLKVRSRRAEAIAARLAREYPRVIVPLRHRNTFELLVATILSAQCTDEAVNRVTPELFRRYPVAAALAAAPITEIQALIRPLGLFRAKARSLKACAELLTKEFQGEVPATMAALTRLPGVGRKTANVILGHAFGHPAIVVDTHCRRVSRRLELTRAHDPDRIEEDLKRLLKPADWTGFSHRLIVHGRRVCHARNPRCFACLLLDLCPTGTGRVG